MGVAEVRYRSLMAAARDPQDIATLALGGVLSRFRLQRLRHDDIDRLFGRYFPGVPVHAEMPCRALQDTEFDDLLGLLLEHRRDDAEDTQWIAHAIVSACAGENHLWEDMGLPNRDTLSQLIRRYFPTLFYKNALNLKWKKFFYKQLCDRAEVRLCKAPSCGVCSDYAACFGGE